MSLSEEETIFVQQQREQYMTTLKITNNPQDKMQHVYIESLQKMVESLCKIINSLISSDQIPSEAHSTVKQILGEIKYYDKFSTKSSLVTNFITETITLIEFNTQHHSFMQTSKLEDSLPPVKISKDTNFKTLKTIQQKTKQENTLRNYVRKQAKKINLSQNQKQIINKGYSRTINQPVSYLNTSRQYDIIREETRKSLDNSGITDKKPLYKDLQRYKGNQQIFPAVKDYLDKRNNAKIKMYKNNNYTIPKFI